MKVVLLVLATLAVSYAVPVFRICENQQANDGTIMFVEKTAGDMVKLNCPGAVCTWYHEDNQISDIYGSWWKTEEQHIQISTATVEDSGTYFAMIGNTKHIYHLTVMPATLTQGTDDLFDDLIDSPTEIVGMTYQNKYLYNTNVNEKKFVNVDFIDIHFHSAEFEYVTFVNVRFTWTTTLPSRVQFYNCNFVNVTWDTALITNSQFRNCKWSEMDTNRAVFKNTMIRNTIFCDNMWTNTKWQDGMVYNTTFVKNWFISHTWMRTHFLSYYISKIDCKAIVPGMMVVDWKKTDGGCQAYVHRPMSQMAVQCNYMDVSERKMCQFYPSVRFLDCTLKRNVHTETKLYAVEWHRTKFDRNVFNKVALEENYFMYCTWISNTWTDAIVTKFVKFMSNDFRGDKMKFTATQKLWFHSSKFFDVDMRWKIRSVSVHFEYCIGEKVMFWGKHSTFRLIHSSMNNIKLQRFILETLEHCNSYLMEWSVVATKIKAVKEVCNGEYMTQYCGSTWTKGQAVTKGDSCDTKDFFTWCQTEYNIRHPACYPFTRRCDPSCCSTKGNGNCGFNPSTWQWWKTMDLKCQEKPTRRMGDAGDLTSARTAPLNKVPFCLESYMNREGVPKRGQSMALWVREFTMDRDSTLPRKFLQDISPPRGLEKIEEHRMRCERMEKGEVRNDCEEEILTKGQLYARLDRARDETKGRVNSFNEALERHVICVK